MRLDVTHLTRYRYDPRVNSAQHLAHVLPVSTAAQTVEYAHLDIDPTPDVLAQHGDGFGNRCVYFSVATEHAQLQVRASSRVITHPQARIEPNRSMSWEWSAEQFHYRAGAPWDPASPFVFDSPYVQADEVFKDFAMPSFEAQRPTLSAAIDLMQRLHRHMRYVSRSTDINTPAHVALQTREGVCQDFAHILLSCLRAMGLAARYVSGYLLTTAPPGQPRLLGADASHAWVSVWVPLGEGSDPAGAGVWVDLDPTNDRWGMNSPGEDYVSVATGRDFGDVSPLRGVLFGGSRHELDVCVAVVALQEEEI